MEFATFEYVAFLAIVWAAYAALRRKGQNVLLLVASYWFYGAWDYRFLSLIVFSTVVDYSVGRYLERVESTGRRKAALLVSIGANLGLLGFFKYFGFFVESAVLSLQALGISAHAPTLHIVLPVGISFYTFQTLGYTVDVYRRQLAPARSLLDFAVYVAFFPQLVAGPIERASNLLPVLQGDRRIQASQVERGLFLILLGMVMKVTIADGLAGSVNAVYETTTAVSGLDVVLATYAFAFQILCDFAAYTNIARGTAKLFGIELMANFDAPYLARSPSEFWRRWHISLSSWLRDYLYISLGGNRGGRFRTYFNLMATMVLGGLWHGAAFNFVLWGIYHGALLCVFRAAGRSRAAVKGLANPSRSLSVKRLLVGAAGIALFFQITCYGWLLFRASSLDQIVTMTSTVLSGAGFTTLSIPRPPLAAVLGVLLLVPWEVLTFVRGHDSSYRSWHPFLQGCLIGVLAILLVMGTNNESSTFIYFQF